MSRVYFHSPSEEAELRGSERAYASNLVNRLALACLQPDGWKMRERLMPLISASSYLHGVRDDAWSTTFETWWSVNMDEGTMRVGSKAVSPWVMSLNTAVVIGSDAIEFLARLHATCEIHGYVEGEHRAWLADIIDAGRNDKVLRADMGWEDVSAMLRRREDEPVVMSYSVCDQFPNAGIAVQAGTWEPSSQDWDAWYDLVPEERWRLSMDALRRVGQDNLNIHPDMWGVRGFGDTGLSVFDLLDALSDPIPA